MDQNLLLSKPMLSQPAVGCERCWFSTNIATRGVLIRLESSKIVFRQGSARTPLEELTTFPQTSPFLTPSTSTLRIPSWELRFVQTGCGALDCGAEWDRIRCKRRTFTLYHKIYSFDKIHFLRLHFSDTFFCSIYNRPSFVKFATTSRSHVVFAKKYSKII